MTYQLMFLIVPYVPLTVGVHNELKGYVEK